jgi:hypothetical protein
MECPSLTRRTFGWVCLSRVVASQRSALSVAFLLALCLAWPGFAVSAEFKTIELADKTRIRYALVLPEAYREGEVYPFILALPPGQQDQAMVEAGMRVYWEEEARRRGVIVVSPVASCSSREAKNTFRSS